jgi:hypothetical protein
VSALPSRRYRVTVIEWLPHVAIIEATSVEQAEEIALAIRGTDAESERFLFEDGGVSDVTVEPVSL